MNSEKYPFIGALFRKQIWSFTLILLTNLFFLAASSNQQQCSTSVVSLSLSDAASRRWIRAQYRIAPFYLHGCILKHGFKSIRSGHGRRRQTALTQHQLNWIDHGLRRGAAWEREQRRLLPTPPNPPPPRANMAQSKIKLCDFLRDQEEKQ